MYAVSQQEAQLLQKDRAMLHVIEYFAKSPRSLKLTQNDTLEQGMFVPISIPLKLCLYFAEVTATRQTSGRLAVSRRFLSVVVK